MIKPGTFDCTRLQKDSKLLKRRVTFKDKSELHCVNQKNWSFAISLVQDTQSQCRKKNLSPPWKTKGTQRARNIKHRTNTDFVSSGLIKREEDAISCSHKPLTRPSVNQQDPRGVGQERNLQQAQTGRLSKQCTYMNHPPPRNQVCSVLIWWPCTSVNGV